MSRSGRPRSRRSPSGSRSSATTCRPSSGPSSTVSRGASAPERPASPPGPSGSLRSRRAGVVFVEGSPGHDWEVVLALNYGPDERSVFETAASELYEDLVTSAGMSSDDARLQDGAFALLREIGLVALDKGADRWMPVDPSIVQSRVVSPLGQQ